MSGKSVYVLAAILLAFATGTSRCSHGDIYAFAFGLGSTPVPVLLVERTRIGPSGQFRHQMTVLSDGTGTAVLASDDSTVFATFAAGPRTVEQLHRDLSEVGTGEFAGPVTDSGSIPLGSMVTRSVTFFQPAFAKYRAWSNTFTMRNDPTDPRAIEAWEIIAAFGQDYVEGIFTP